MMEFCSLGSVQNAMNLLGVGEEGQPEGPWICEEDLAYIIKSVVLGLAYLHSKKIIHR